MPPHHTYSTNVHILYCDAFGVPVDARDDWPRGEDPIIAIAWLMCLQRRRLW
jgi:hypothetical protein